MQVDSKTHNGAASEKPFSTIAMPPLSPVRVDIAVATQSSRSNGGTAARATAAAMGASPDPLDATRAPKSIADDDVENGVEQNGAHAAGAEEAFVPAASHPQRRASSLASVLSTGMLPDGFYYYYGSEDGLDSPNSESYSTYARHLAQGGGSSNNILGSNNNNNSGSGQSTPIGSRRRLSLSSSAAAIGGGGPGGSTGSRQSCGATSPANGSSGTAGLALNDAPAGTPPRSPQSLQQQQSQRSLHNGHGGDVGATGSASLAGYHRRLSQNSIVSCGAASSRSPRSPGLRYHDSISPPRDNSGRLEPSNGPSPLHLDGPSNGSQVRREDSPSDEGPAPAPASRSPPSGPVNSGAAKTQASTSATERRLFETDASRGVQSNGTAVERQRHKAPVKPSSPRSYGGSGFVAVAAASGGGGANGSTVAERTPQRRAPVPQFRITPYTTPGALASQGSDAQKAPTTLAVDQLRRDILAQQVTPRVQAFFRTPASNDVPAAETVVIGYGFSCSRNGASTTRAAAEGTRITPNTPANGALTQIVLERVTSDAEVPWSQSELAWGHDLPARPEDDLLLFGGAGEELLLLGDTDLLALTAATASPPRSHNPDHHAEAAVAARPKASILARDGVLLERACSEVTRGLLPSIALLVSAQGASRRVGQRARTSQSDKQGSEVVSEELTMSVFVLPITVRPQPHRAEDARAASHAVAKQSVFADLLQPLAAERQDESGISYDRHVRLVPQPTLLHTLSPYGESGDERGAVSGTLFAHAIRREEEALEVLSSALARWYHLYHHHHLHQQQHQKGSELDARASLPSDPPLGHLCIQFDLFALQGEATASPRGPRGRLSQPLVRTAAQHQSTLHVVELCAHVLADTTDAMAAVPPSPLSPTTAAALDSRTRALLSAATSATTPAECAGLWSYVSDPANPTSLGPLWVIDAVSPADFPVPVQPQQQQQPVAVQAVAPNDHQATLPVAEPTVRAQPSAVATASASDDSAPSVRVSVTSDKVPLTTISSVREGHSVASSSSKPSPKSPPDIALKLQTLRPDTVRATTSATTTRQSTPPASQQQQPVVPRLAMERLTPNPAPSAAPKVAPKKALTTAPAAKAGSPRPSAASAAVPASGSSTSRRAKAAAAAATTATKSASPRNTAATAAKSASPRTTAATTARSPRPLLSAPKTTAAPRAAPVVTSASSPRPLLKTRTSRGPAKPAGSASPRPLGSGRSPRQSAGATVTKTQRTRVRSSSRTDTRSPRGPVLAGDAPAPPVDATFQRTVTDSLEQNAAAAHVARMAAGRERRKKEQQDAANVARTWSPPPVAGQTADAVPASASRDAVNGRHSMSSFATPRGSGVATARKSSHAQDPHGRLSPRFSESSLSQSQKRSPRQRTSTGALATAASPSQPRTRAASQKKSKSTGAVPPQRTTLVTSLGVRSVSPAAYQRISSRQQTSRSGSAPPRPATATASASPRRLKSSKPAATTARTTTAATTTIATQAPSKQPSTEPFARMHSAKPLRSAAMRAASAAPAAASKSSTTQKANRQASPRSKNVGGRKL